MNAMDEKRASRLVWDIVYIGLIAYACRNLLMHSRTGDRHVAGNVIAVLIGAAGLVMNRWAPAYLRRQQKNAATAILSQQIAVYGEPHEYRLAKMEEFPDLDRGFYESCRSWFEQHSFRYVGDRENMTLTGVYPNMRTMLRSFIGSDGTILGSVYHIRKKAGKDVNKTIDFETETSIGTFITTSNTLDTARVLPFPGIKSQRLPAETLPEELLRLHLESLRHEIELHPGLTFTRCSTLEEFIAFQRRMHAMKVMHKKKVGYISAADLEAVRRRPLNEHEKAVAQEIERLKASGGTTEA